MGCMADRPLKNVSCLLTKSLSIFVFALLLGGLSIRFAYQTMERERDNAEERSTKQLYECCDLHSKLRDTVGELHQANERQQASDNDADAERREFHNTTQDLHSQNSANQEEIRSLKRQISNTECNRDEFRRKLDCASRESRILVRENQDLKRENQNLNREKQQLNKSVAEGEETIKNLQAHHNDRNRKLITATPIYIQSNDMELAERKGSFQRLEQRNKTLTSEIEGLRAELESLRDEHGKCSGDLHSQLADKDATISNVLSEKKTADDESAKTIASLRVELGEKAAKVEDLEEANGKMVAGQTSSAHNVQRLNRELEVSRQAHLQCDENSARQTTRVGKLVTEKEKLEERLQASNEEVEILQGRVTKSANDLQELQESHVNAQASEITQLQSLQRTNIDLSQQLGTARNDLANLTLEGRRVEERNRTLEGLQSCRQGETRSLQAQIQTLSQTVDHQQQRIYSLERNCPRCRDLRVALDAVVKDVEMSDEESRAEMKRQVAEELRSQVPDDLRRQIRGEVVGKVREEFQKHYSDILQKNTRRIQEQDRLIKEKDAQLEKSKNNPTLNHAACEQRESNLQSLISQLKQDAKIGQGNFSRLRNGARDNCEQLSEARKANEDLRTELETIKADQRRAETINPLRSRLAACQRDAEKMKIDRDKARDNGSTYFKNLSDLRKTHEALRNEHMALKEKFSLDGDRSMENGRSAEPITASNDPQMKDQAMEIHDAFPGDQALPIDEDGQQMLERSFPDKQSSAIPTVDRDEAAALDLLRHEVDLREARNGKAKVVYATPAALARPTQDSDNEADIQTPLPTGGAEKQDEKPQERGSLETKPVSKPQGRSSQGPAPLPARQPTTMPLLGGVAGRKRERDEDSEGKTEKEGADDRKKLRIGIDEIEERVRRLGASKDS